MDGIHRARTIATGTIATGTIATGTIATGTTATLGQLPPGQLPPSLLSSMYYCSENLQDSTNLDQIFRPEHNNLFTDQD